MSTGRPGFKEWRALATESPLAAVDDLLNRIGGLPDEQRSALLAALPGRTSLMTAFPPQPGPGEDLPPLFGVPFVLQDLFDVEGLPTLCGADLDETLKVPAELSSFLCRELGDYGAWFVGKAVPSEFGVDSRGRNRTFGSAPHALGPDYVAGGGAGACAALVASGVVPLAFGLDTIGGVRIPASFNGLFGFRMGHNQFARDGVFPIAPSLDAVGWMTGSPADMKAVLRAVYALEDSDQEYAGFFLEDLSGTLDPEMKTASMRVVRELSLDEDPSMRTELLAAFKGAGHALSILMSRELYSVHRYWIEEYGTRYDPALAKIIRRGMDYSAKMAEDAVHAQDMMVRSFSRFFETYDYLVLPACLSLNPLAADWGSQMESELLALMAPVSLAGLPTLLLPVFGDDGRTGGLQLIFNPRNKAIPVAVLDLLSDFYGGTE